MNKIAYFNVKNKKIVDTAAKGLPVDQFIPLSKKQTSFRKKNAGASYMEIMNCALKETNEPGLEEIKQFKVQELSHQSLQRLDELLPGYQFNNALAGVYDQEKAGQIKEKYKRLGMLLRSEFYRVKQIVEQSATIDEINAIVANFKDIK